MPSIAERRKLKRRNQLYELEEDSILRQKGVKATPPPSADEFKKTIKKLESMVNEQREKRVEVEDYLKLMRERNIMRENQFYSVLETTHKEIKRYMSPGSEKQSTVSEILDIFKEIVLKFEEANEATHHFIEQRYEQNYAMMERKVFTIMQTFETEIAQNKKLSEDSSRIIKAEIKQVLNLGKLIDEQNWKMKTEISNLNFKCKVLQEEKSLLIQEMVHKKRVISKLHRCKTKNREERSTSAQNSEMMQDLSKFGWGRFTSEQTLQPQEFRTNKSMKGWRSDLKCGKGPSRRNSRDADMMFSSTPLKQSQIDPSKTIESLKLCLGRQKRKVFELGKIVSQVQKANKQLNETITESLTECRNDDKLEPESILKSEKLFQTIKQLKKRLAACETPSINCGWGESDLKQLMAVE